MVVPPFISVPPFIWTAELVEAVVNNLVEEVELKVLLPPGSIASAFQQ
jgi:hypothetical protein